MTNSPTIVPLMSNPPGCYPLLPKVLTQQVTLSSYSRLRGNNPWMRFLDKQQSSCGLPHKQRIYLGKGKEGRVFFQTPNAEGRTALTRSG